MRFVERPGSQARPENVSLRHCGSSGSFLGLSLSASFAVQGWLGGPGCVCTQKPALAIHLLGLWVHGLHVTSRTARVSFFPTFPKGHSLPVEP